MTDTQTKLQVAEVRVDQVQAVLDEVRKVLNTAEKAQAAAERARGDFHKVAVAALGVTALVAVAAILSRRGH